MAMMTLAHRMQVFGVVHTGLHTERSKLRGDAARKVKIMGRIPDLMMPNEFLSFAAGLLGMPIPLTQIVTMQFLFVVARNERCFGVFRSSFDGFPNEVNEDFRFFPADSFNPLG